MSLHISSTYAIKLISRYLLFTHDLGHAISRRFWSLLADQLSMPSLTLLANDIISKNIVIFMPLRRFAAFIVTLLYLKKYTIHYINLIFKWHVAKMMSLPTVISIYYYDTFRALYKAVKYVNAHYLAMLYALARLSLPKSVTEPPNTRLCQRFGRHWSLPKIYGRNEAL